MLNQPRLTRPGQPEISADMTHVKYLVNRIQVRVILWQLRRRGANLMPHMANAEELREHTHDMFTMRIARAT
jgi:hypothetical protein